MHIKRQSGVRCLLVVLIVGLGLGEGTGAVQAQALVSTPVHVTVPEAPVHVGPDPDTPVRTQRHAGDRLHLWGRNATGTWLQLAPPLEQDVALWVQTALTDVGAQRLAVLPIMADFCRQPFAVQSPVLAALVPGYLRYGVSGTWPVAAPVPTDLRVTGQTTNLQAHHHGHYVLYQPPGTSHTVGATFYSSSSPVQHYARADHGRAPVFRLPTNRPELWPDRPVRLPVTMAIQVDRQGYPRWPATASLDPIRPDQTGYRFDLEVLPSGEVYYVDDARVRAVPCHAVTVADLQTLLHDAVHQKDEVMMVVLLAAGTDVNTPDSKGHMPLHKAVVHGTNSIVSQLLMAGADVNTLDSWGRSPLVLAVVHGTNSVVSQLLAAGADITAQDHEGRTPLHWAALIGLVQKVDQLLAAGADITAQDHEGRMPLHMAIPESHMRTDIHIPVIERLLAAGADIDAQDHAGQTPLHWAISRASEKLVPFLLAAEADINAQDHAGQTPLHLVLRQAPPSDLVARQKKVLLVSWLLAAGADVNAPDAAGWTPLQWALSSDWVRSSDTLFWLLVAAGAVTNVP